MIGTGRPLLPQSRTRAIADPSWSAPFGTPSDEYTPPSLTNQNLLAQPYGTLSDPIDVDVDHIVSSDDAQYYYDGLYSNNIANDARFTAEDCLRHILELFPDISHEYVFQCYTDAAVHGPVDLAVITDGILNRTSYPRENDAKAKRATETGKVQGSEMCWQNAPIDSNLADTILREEFNTIAVKRINSIMCTEKNFLSTYLTLDDIQNSHGISSRLKRRRSSSKANIKLSQLAEAELIAARVEAAKRRAQRTASQEEHEAEERNKRNAVNNGSMTVCACCFNDVPSNRTAHCGGLEPHLFCFDCTMMNAETEIGHGKCRPKCMDQSSCKAQFADHQLRLCLGVKTMVRLNRLQQQHDLKEAGIEGLEECPFCNYMAVCPSSLVDREFRCGEPDCGKISCRLCQHETHIPLSCEMAAEVRNKDKKIDARHFVEEAMTEALIRTCNNPKCKYRFVKIEGCNKMRCPQCGNMQCYICSETIKDYKHFNIGGCAMHDDQGVEVRHREEVQKAEEAASAKIQAEIPGINADDLSIKVSAAVKADEEIGAERWAMPFHNQQFAGYIDELGGRNPAFARAFARNVLPRADNAALTVAPFGHDELGPLQHFPPGDQRLPHVREVGDPAKLMELIQAQAGRVRAKLDRLREAAERHQAETKRLRADTGDHLHNHTSDYLAAFNARKAQLDHQFGHIPVGDFNEAGTFPTQPRQHVLKTQPRDLALPTIHDFSLPTIHDHALPAIHDHALREAPNHISSHHGYGNVGTWSHDLRKDRGQPQNQRVQGFAPHGHAQYPHAQYQHPQYQYPQYQHPQYQHPHAFGSVDPYLYGPNPYLDPLMKPLTKPAQGADLLAQQTQESLPRPPGPQLDQVQRHPNPEKYPKGLSRRPTNPQSTALPIVETPAQRRKRLDNIR